MKTLSLPFFALSEQTNFRVRNLNGTRAEAEKKRPKKPLSVSISRQTFECFFFFFLYFGARMLKFCFYFWFCMYSENRILSRFLRSQDIFVRKNKQGYCWECHLAQDKEEDFLCVRTNPKPNTPNFPSLPYMPEKHKVHNSRTTFGSNFNARRKKIRKFHWSNE